MVDVSGNKDLSGILERTLAELQELLGPSMTLSWKSSDTLEVLTDMGRMDAVAKILSEHPMVAQVQPDGVVYPNSLQASEAVQSGSGASEHRVWDKGLLGDGEVRSLLLTSKRSLLDRKA